LKLKALSEERYRVVGVVEGDECPAETFLVDGEASTEAAREGLLEMLEYVAQVGLQGVPAAWLHEANKSLGVYEFIKGPLRLFFFKGDGRDIAVCTGGVRKSGRKADRSATSRAGRLRSDYFAAVERNSVEVVYDETEQEAEDDVGGSEDA
jgi:hypothetical protein